MPQDGADPVPPPPQQRKKSVVVIGGGLAGLAAAKAAVQAGLSPTLFDRRPSLGGMWGYSAASTYASLHTNVSRFACSFSDFPWPPGSPDFPNAAEVGEYLSAYQRAFLPPDRCRLRLGCEVSRVTPPQPGPVAPPAPDDDPHSPNPDPVWSVEWREAQPPSSEGGADPPLMTHGSVTDRFDFVVVASGFCAAPRIPPIPGLDAFPGLVLHSTTYRGPHCLAGRRRVAVMGAGHSAVDIAADLAAAATAAAAAGAGSLDPTSNPCGSELADAHTSPPMEVIHVTPRPLWVIPRYLAQSTGSAAVATPFVPLDFVFHSWSSRPAGEAAWVEKLLQTRDDHVRFNAFFAAMLGDQGAALSPALAIPPDSPEPPVVAISDAYRPLVASGRLKVIRGRLLRAVGSTLELSNAPADCCSAGGDGGAAVAMTASVAAAAAPPPPPLSLRDVDAIVLCSGMHPSLSFLPSDVLKTLSYTPYDDYLPLALHRQVLHPDVPGLAFVGVFRSPFFAMVELQARLAAAAFTGSLPAAEADLAAQRAGVELELRVRQHTPRLPYPYSDFVGHTDGLAAALGVRPPAEWRAEHDIVIAAHYAAFPPPPSPATADTGAASAATATAALARDDEAAAASVRVRQALEDVAAAVRGYRSGRRVASAVFQDLAGEWALRRRIVSRLVSSPSGEVTGRARFTATAATTAANAPGGGFTPAASGAGGLSYLYEEQGQFAMEGGATMRVRREYVYEYDSTADRINVYFAEGGSRRGAFFHSLRFLPPPEEPSSSSSSSSSAAAATEASTPAAAGGGTAASASAAPAAGCWQAIGDHLCGRDMYDASYRFCFQGVRLLEFEIQFRVKGPNKDYTATAAYTRRPQ